MKWKVILLSILTFLYAAVQPVMAKESIGLSSEQRNGSVSSDNMMTEETGKLIIDAGQIEWEDNYLTATEGFILRFNGMTATGNTLLYNLTTGLYQLEQVGFTACTKEQPHYQILAKRVELLPGEYLAFSGVQLQVGSVRIPFLPRLVLLYQDGAYQFPDWLPEVTYGDEGLGIKLKAEYRPNRQVRARGAFEVTTHGGINLEGTGQYQLKPGVVLGADVVYDDQWEGGINLDWNQGWNAALRAKLVEGTVFPQFTAEMKEREIGGISYKFLAGVTLVTENDPKERHNKLYAQNQIHDRYTLGNISLAWSLDETPFWVQGYSAGGESRFDLDLQARFNQNWSGQLGYGRIDHWGRLPETFYSVAPDAYLEAGAGYHWRNQMDEGWDVEALAQYSLVNRRLNFGKTKLIKAYDCFEIELNVEWVKPQATIGLRLKY